MRRLKGDAGIGQGPKNPLSQGQRGARRGKLAGVVVGLFPVRVGLRSRPRGLGLVAGERGEGGRRRLAERRPGVGVGRGGAAVARRVVTRGQRGGQVVKGKGPLGAHAGGEGGEEKDRGRPVDPLAAHQGEANGESGESSGEVP